MYLRLINVTSRSVDGIGKSTSSATLMDMGDKSNLFYVNNANKQRLLHPTAVY
jgi:hypothetical protein